MAPAAEGLEGGHSSLSQTTEHALIALGSIGATILVFLVGWFIYHTKLSICTNEKCIMHRRDRYKSIKEVTPPLGRWSVAGSEWRHHPRTKSAAFDWMRQNTVAESVLQAPAATLKRDSSRSKDHGSRQPRAFIIPSQASPQQASIPKDVPVANADDRHLSLAPSSPVLPLHQKPHNSYWSRSRSSSRSSLPSYLKGVPGISRLQPETSRFSWTDSQAPRTPTTSQTRYSNSTSRSSVPRFRTIESWVGNQAARIEPNLVQEQVPAVPAKYQKTGPEQSDARFFHQHPGTKIHLPRTSLVPSEILDQSTKRNTGASF